MADHDDIEVEGFTTEEREAVRWAHALGRVNESALRALGHQNSRRAKQRAVALLLGHANSGEIRVWSLRRLLLDLAIYNEPNFAQDMKKDSVEGRGADEGLWTIHTYRGRGLEGRWRLTKRGEELAAEYARLVDTAAEREVEKRIDDRKRVALSVSQTFTIRPKAARCPFCRENITDDDKAVCDCGSAVHATCLDEFEASDRCVLYQTTARCRGHYKVIAKPARAVERAAESPEEK